MNNLEYNMMNVEQTLAHGGPVYLFSNENIPESLVQVGRIQGRRVLTVASSGDHAFEAYRMGAAHVDTFDFNIMQQGVLDLKTAAIHHLSQEKFMEFFGAGKQRLNDETASQLWPHMTLAAKKFLVMHKKYDHQVIRSDHRDFRLPSGLYFDNEKAYAELKSKLPNRINFIHSDLQNLESHLTMRYDVIMLSNILSYLFTDSDKNTFSMEHMPLGQMYDEILKPLADKHLTPDGCICVQYNWGFGYLDYPTMMWENTLKEQNQRIAKNNHMFDLCYVMSQCPHAITDTVTILRQKRR